MDHAADAQRTDFDDHHTVRAERAVEAPGVARRLHHLAHPHCSRMQVLPNSLDLLAKPSCRQGEEQKKLDVLSNEVFVKALVNSGRTCILVSEEDEEATFVEPSMRGRYCLVFDPLDGSSNIDCGVSIVTMVENQLWMMCCNLGRIWWLQAIARMEALARTSTFLNANLAVTKKGDAIPKKGKIYSVNEGNAKNWDGPTAKYVNKCKFPTDGSSSKSLRCIGSMVADVHHTLLYGGIFLYPADKKSPNGKLRVLYEVFPMSFLMEQAGG
ncbi:inositol monophosphatase family protein [Actinidia rufa]|uniref:Fructose-1,6-bisphosphatase, cytosolic n=1 Tax=Actinidia rufa TaxID=165716 RepID=A0A7J0GGN0_9ERIC|nr:inositol monophosphatase family protein [Actinidia rufa]